MSQPHTQETTYTDELLADRSVHRRYSDGRQEWRSRGSRGEVRWRDDRGDAGTDEPLGRDLVKRTFDNGRVLYGREGGYGRTLWSNGVLTVNRTSLGGRMGTVLAAVAGGALVGAVLAPPAFLSPDEEEELRREAEAQVGGAGGGEGGEGGEDAGYGDWGDAGGAEDDFG
ncbi:hypothetical protein [Streptomyces sp. MP131-18]|uniref:hypothetical protein n=1 Tax=Streptomyces sp. MP131-18 TaxID=1857892 RepID=UPI00097BB75F|nr:hypothetical protein [Streptomyces sp. MP131-18]ONK11263.1 hypothetical protein STBA_19940 [Streptomyces sp. MP131-18]